MDELPVHLRKNLSILNPELNHGREAKRLARFEFIAFARQHFSTRLLRQFSRGRLSIKFCVEFVERFWVIREAFDPLRYSWRKDAVVS